MGSASPVSSASASSASASMVSSVLDGARRVCGTRWGASGGFSVVSAWARLAWE